MANLSIQKGLAVGVRDDIRSIVDTLGGGIVADSIQERPVPSLRDYVKNSPAAGQHILPGILVVYPTSGETLDHGVTNLDDAWGFPVLVAIAAPSQQDLSANDDRYLFWRETIIARYITKRFTISDPSTGFDTCRVEPGPISDWDQWAKQGNFASWFILRFFIKHKRRP